MPKSKTKKPATGRRTAKKPRPQAKLTTDARPIRDGFGDGLIEAARRDKRVIGLSADVTESVRMATFEKEFPDRFVQLGVHEQLLVALSAGMALSGKIPFAATYAVFSPGRSWEQIRTNVCLNGAGVKLVGSHAGVTVGPDGATHQALEDIALMRVLPKMTVVVPADAEEARRATIAAAAWDGPVYLRLSRERAPVVSEPEHGFTIGRAIRLLDGYDCAVIACGVMVGQALEAAAELAEERIECLVLNCHTVKPLDAEEILAAAERCRCVVTAEEHQVAGGLGSAVAELLTAKLPVPQEFVGVRDQFGESGQAGELIEKFGLGSSAIKSAVRRVIERKKKIAQKLEEEIC